MHIFQEKVKVLWNKKIGSSYYRIGLKCHSEYLYSKPGQFIMLRLSDQIVPLLRRPFSIHRLIAKDKYIEGIELLYNVVGECTKKLSMARKGDIVDILGPLGNGFLIPDNYRRIFIVAGGVGVAPMLFLALSLQKKGVDLSECMVFIGGRSKDDLLCKDDFLNLKMRVHITTDDGSAGIKGLITDPLESAIKENRPDIICACGSFAMLRSVAQIAEMHAVPCQVSIETIMACGIGACLGCAVESRDGTGKYLHACLDGPVFDAGAIKM